MERFLSGCVLLTAALVGEFCFCVTPGSATEERAIWVRRIVNLDESANSSSQQFEQAKIESVSFLPGYRDTAEGWGPFLMELDPEFSLAVVEEVWPRLTTRGVKLGLLRAFTDGPHPYLHRVLHLGMTDPDSVVREYAIKQLEKIAFRTFGEEDRDDYLLWYNQSRDRSVKDVIHQSYLRLVERLTNLDRTTGIDVLRNTRAARWRYRRDSIATLKRECIKDVRLVDLVESWLEDPDASPDEIEDVLYIWGGIVSEPDREFVESVIVPLTRLPHPLRVRCEAVERLGLPGNEWALPVVLEFVEEARPYWEDFGSDEERDRIRNEDPETWEQLLDKVSAAYDFFKEIQPSDEQIQQHLLPLLREDFPAELRREIVRMIGDSGLPDAADLLLEPLVRFERFISGDDSLLPYYFDVLEEIGDPRAIPTLIGVIDADNSEDTIELGGYLFIMEALDHWSPLYDGAWWRRWWQEHKSRYDAEVQRIPVPDLPKTEHGKTYTPFPEEMFTNDGLMEYVKRHFKAGDLEMVESLFEVLLWRGEERAIPLMIGIIDACDTDRSVRGLNMPLSRLTGVPPVDRARDGAWWRRWWELNKHHFPEEVRRIPIPDLPKLEYEEEDQQFKLELPNVESAARTMIRLFRERDFDPLCALADDLAEREQFWAIPLMIGLINSDNTPATIGGFGVRALPKLTGVEYDESHDVAWWTAWWGKNKPRYPEAVQQLSILADPYDSNVVERWVTKVNASAEGYVAFAFDLREQPEPPEEMEVEAEPEIPDATDVADIPSDEVFVGGNPKMRYFLIGPRAGTAAPAKTYKLVLILPGGIGTAGFHPFVKRVYKHALGEDYIAAQLVAVKWRPWQRTVWPSERNPVPGQEFSTEDFVDAVIADAKTRHPINDNCIFQLAWSSSGPAAYRISVQENTPITGSYIAMSTWSHYRQLNLENAKGRPYFILHSPEDQTASIRSARRAREALAEAGANVRMVPYQGGHGWHEDVYGSVRQGIQWLEQQVRASGDEP
jgi:hypothetical protein